jgi:molecular chaperone DnaJ
MAKSYYAVRGVTPSASPDEIRAAYRRLAKEFHPDRCTGGGERFVQIQEGDSSLNDRDSRSAYEKPLFRSPVKRSRPAGSPPEAEPLIPRQRPVDMGEISPFGSFQTFAPSPDEIFDWLWNNFSSLDPPKSGRLQNLTLEILLTSEEAVRGGNARIMVPAHAVCPVCHGFGDVGFHECPRCAGEGAISGEMPISISFPAGLMRDHALVIPLERFGIKNLRLTVLFRLTDE